MATPPGVLIAPVDEALRWTAEREAAIGFNDPSSLVQKAIERAVGWRRFAQMGWSFLQEAVDANQESVVAALRELLTPEDLNTGSICEVRVFVLHGSAGPPKSGGGLLSWLSEQFELKVHRRYNCEGTCTRVVLPTLSSDPYFFLEPPRVPTSHELGLEEPLRDMERVAQQFGDAYLFKASQTYNCVHPTIGTGPITPPTWESELVLIRVRKERLADVPVTMELTLRDGWLLASCSCDSLQEHMNLGLDPCDGVDGLRAVLAHRLGMPEWRLGLRTGDGRDVCGLGGETLLTELLAQPVMAACTSLAVRPALLGVSSGGALLGNWRL